MFKVGDIVRPRATYNGNDMLFYITECRKSNCKFEDVYRIKPFRYRNYLPPEDIDWSEKELIYIASWNWFLRTMDERRLTRNELEQELLKENIPELKEVASEIIKSKEKENEMKILDIYKERKFKEINEKYENKKSETMKEDLIFQILEEAENRVNAILEEEDQQGKLIIYRPDFLTQETKEEISKLVNERDIEKKRLELKIEEIQALFEMTEDYTERMKILKKYGIIGKDGKLNI